MLLFILMLLAMCYIGIGFFWFLSEYIYRTQVKNIDTKLTELIIPYWLLWIYSITKDVCRGEIYGIQKKDENE